MTVAEVIEELSKFPPGIQVVKQINEEYLGMHASEIVEAAIEVWVDEKWRLYQSEPPYNKMHPEIETVVLI